MVLQLPCDTADPELFESRTGRWKRPRLYMVHGVSYDEDANRGQRQPADAPTPLDVLNGQYEGCNHEGEDQDLL